MSRVSLLLLPVLLFAPRIPAQADWVDRTPATGNAPARWTDAIAYDSARQRTVVFGGFAASYSRSNGTWEWDGTRWVDRTQVTGGPSARVYCRMAFDSAQAETVLFGGWATGDQLDDTWTWDGTRWADRTLATGNPPGRMGHAMAFDSTRGRVVMFGGMRLRSSNTLDDTWEWDGSTWRERPSWGYTGPRRAYHAMAYDAARGRVVMFGGSGFAQFGDTWEWDGQRWYDRTPSNGASPPVRDHHGMAYDATIGRVVLFGGVERVGSWQWHQDTWLWDGTNWTEVKTSIAPPGRRTAMTFDSARGVAVLFGGTVVNGVLVADTWELSYSNQAGGFQSFGAGCGPAPQLSLAPAAGSRARLGHALELVTTNARGRFAGLLTAGARRVAPIPLDGIGMKGCFLYHSLDAAWLFPIQVGTGRGRIPIPYEPGLIGEKFYVQSAAGPVSSNAGEVLIGVR